MEDNRIYTTSSSSSFLPPDAVGRIGVTPPNTHTQERNLPCLVSHGPALVTMESTVPFVWRTIVTGAWSVGSLQCLWGIWVFGWFAYVPSLIVIVSISTGKSGWF